MLHIVTKDHVMEHSMQRIIRSLIDYFTRKRLGSPLTGCTLGTNLM